ncbi:serine hydrolase [Brevibacillus brevis]|uniref:Serine hydrolase n=1 Tax=Brevibacillus brevis TaxID=1393 RepID=A0ABY9T950_BREBE|nr:serine hydrolase [Brevibacillus brevis]WNC16428.1 serine hydrolase [Brevibacillus brevis]
MKKRAVIVGLCVCLCAGLICPAWAAQKPDGEKKPRPVPHPLTHAWDAPGPSRTELRPGSPAEAGLSEKALDQIDQVIQSAIERKLVPGAVVLVARRGVIAWEQAYGYAAKYADDGYGELRSPVRMRTDTLFDLASVSKLFTAVAVMQLYDQGRIRLDEPVVTYLPDFVGKGKEKVTVRQLLTHTSGFAAYVPLYKQGGSREALLQTVLRLPLAEEPGRAHVYSDVNMLVLGVLVERLSGKRLDDFIRESIAQPLGLAETMYNPPPPLRKRSAATEYQAATDRGLIWGQVQDENAWALGGVAGHAGLFGTARDLAVFAQMMLNGGTYGGKRILSEKAAAWMAQNQLSALSDEKHGLGWQLDRGTYMDALGDSRSMGHTGFTGTSLLVSHSQQAIVIFLTNRIHPVRDTASLTPLRNAVARQASLAISVDIPWQDGAWFAGTGDDRQATLTAEASMAAGGTLTYDTWYRIENEYDYGYVEVSPDKIRWKKLGDAATGESDWVRVSWRLPEGVKYIRFRYETDGTINGRGWYVHHPVLLDRTGRKIGTDWLAEGWSREGGREEKP